jgi:hypothetical protein
VLMGVDVHPAPEFTSSACGMETILGRKLKHGGRRRAAVLKFGPDFLALAHRVAGERDLARKRSLIIPGFLVKFVYLFSITLLDHFAAKF